MNKDEYEWAKENKAWTQSLEEEYAKAFLEEVKKLTPVKTGRLKAGWRRDKNVVSNDVEYLEYVDQGTRYIKPRRFIEAAFQRVMNDDKIGRKN